MPLRRHLPAFDRERIIGMLLAGQTQRHVGRQFNVSHPVVGRVWQRYLDTGSVVERAGRGRPRKTKDRDDRYIVNMAKRRRFESAKTLNANFREASGVRICEQTFSSQYPCSQASRPPTIDPRTQEVKTCLCPRTPKHSNGQAPVCALYKRVKVLC